MSILVKEKEHTVLAICGNCHHGTDKGKPCRWCGDKRARQIFSASEEREREFAQASFNKRMLRGII